MNVVIVMPLGEQRGGGELMLVHLLENALDLGVRWTVVFLEDGPLVTWCRDLGIDTHVVPAGRLRQPRRTLGAVRAIARIARAADADLIFGWMAKAHLYGAPAGRLAGIPAAYYQVAVPTPASRLDRIANRLPGCGVLTLSSDALDAQRTHWPKRPTRLVYPGVDLTRFDPERVGDPADARRRLGLPENRTLVGLVGRLQTWKGVHTLLDALPRIRERHPDVYGVVVGGEHELEADYAHQVRTQASRLGLDDHLCFTGHQTNVPEWMNALDIVVHASDAEPFGIVVIEAMALGKPLVAGAEGGPREIITPGENGLLAAFEDVPALTHAVTHLLDDRAAARAMGDAARVRAADFSTRRFARNVVAALHDLGQPSTAPASFLSGAPS